MLAAAIRAGKPLTGGFVDEVEGRFGGAAEPGDAGVYDDVPDRGLAGLRSECVPAGLGQGVRNAEQRREAVAFARRSAQNPVL
jgi:hypothetical protein